MANNFAVGEFSILAFRSRLIFTCISDPHDCLYNSKSRHLATLPGQPLTTVG